MSQPRKWDDERKAVPGSQPAPAGHGAAGPAAWLREGPHCGLRNLGPGGPGKSPENECHPEGGCFSRLACSGGEPGRGRNRTRVPSTMQQAGAPDAPPAPKDSWGPEADAPRPAESQQNHPPLEPTVPQAGRHRWGCGGDHVIQGRGRGQGPRLPTESRAHMPTTKDERACWMSKDSGPRQTPC